jgi:hypothetical protein
MTLQINRREALALGAASLASLSLGGATKDRPATEIPATLVSAHDESLANRMRRQVLDPDSRWHGAVPDGNLLHTPHAAADLLYYAAAAYFQPLSSFHQSPELFDRMKWAAAFLERVQTPDGNIDLMETNFNSPPDTAFVVHKIGTAARIAQRHDGEAVLLLLRRFLQRAGRGMARGGIHTPNHRWVVCAALAQVHELFPRSLYLDRINAWLAEGIDIDEEGQYIERSTTVYNGAVNHALTVMAVKLNRPELLEPVRKNLDAMTWLIHPNGEVVTEISRRQDAHRQGDLGNYWFALRYLAILDGNGQYAAMLAPIDAARMNLPALMEYPEIQASLPTAAPLPDHFKKEYPLSGITRIRKGRLSATLMHERSGFLLRAHFGGAVLQGIRFASAFFGKGEFNPGAIDRLADGFEYRQELKGQYYQPLREDRVQPVTRDNWGIMQMQRETSEECIMNYLVRLREIDNGFSIFIQASGTDNVPLAVEIGLRPGGEFDGAVPAPNVNNGFLLREGFATYRVGEDTIRIGPGKAEHGYTQVRGASGRLSGMSLYLTGLTPFEHSFSIEMG